MKKEKAICKWRSLWGARDDGCVVEASLSESLRALPRPVWILFVGTFVNKFGAFVVPFLTLYLSGMGFGMAEAGAALAAYGLGNIAAAICGGYLADEIGRRKTIVISMAAGAVAMVALSVATTLPVILGLAVLAGLSAEMYRPAASAMIVDLVPAEHRVTAFAAYRLSFNAGWTLGPAVAGLMAKHSYHYLFWGDAISCVVFGIVAWFLLPRGVRNVRANIGWSESLKSIFSDRRFVRVLATYLAIGVILFQYISTFPVYLRDLGYDESFYGLVLGLNGLMVVLFELPMTRLTMRFRPEVVVAFGYGLMALGVAMNAYPVAAWWIVAGMAVMSLGEIVSMPTASAYVAGIAPEAMRGRYMGAVALSWSSCHAVAPPLGLLVLAISPVALWVSCGVIGLLGAVAFSRLRPGKAPAEVIDFPVAESRDSA